MERQGMERAAGLIQGLVSSGGAVAERHLAFAELREGEAPASVTAVDGGSRLLYDLPGLIIGAFRVCATTMDSAGFHDSRGEVAIVALRKGETPEGAPAGTSDDAEESATAAIGLQRSTGEWSRTLEAVKAAKMGEIILADGNLDPPEAACRALASDSLALARERGAVLVGVSKRSELAVEGFPAIPLAAWQGRKAMASSAWTCALPSQSGSFSTFAVKFIPSSRFVFRVDVASDDAPGVLSALATLCHDAGYPGYPYPLARAHNLAVMDGALCDDLRFQLDEAVRRKSGDAFWQILKNDFHSVLDGGVR